MASAPIANAQETPPDVDNSEVLKAQGATFKEGWNFFTLGFNECNAKTVLDELQADGGSALKAATLFTKELFKWEPYSFLNPDAKDKKIGENQLLAFYSNQNFFLEISQDICLNPDNQRQAQIEQVREGTSDKSSFIEKVSELPVDLWTKLVDLLNRDEASFSQNNISENKDFENLTIGGKTTVNDLGITGKISQGLLAINGLDTGVLSGSATINTLSNDLYLQNLGVGGVNILGGLVTIDKKGNLKAQKLNIDTSNSTSSAIGKGTMPAGQKSITISTTAVTSVSMIFVTLETVNDLPLAVTSKIPGQSFKVESLRPVENDLKFNWWVVN